MKKGALTLKDKLPLFFKSLLKKETPWYAKALILFTIAYVVTPIDLLPEALGPLGLVDDALMIPLMANLVVSLLPNELIADQVFDNDKRPIKEAKKVD